MSGPKDKFTTSANDKIVDARLMARPADGKAGEKYGVPHVGIQMKTEKGDIFTTHSTPGSGVKTTDANLSSRWQEVRKLDVCPEKTLGGANKAAGADHKQDPMQNYMDNKTCLGAAGKTVQYLESCDKRNDNSSKNNNNSSDSNKNQGGGSSSGSGGDGCSIA